MAIERKSKRARRRRKRCEFCEELFEVDPRLGSRHRACSAACCQQARRAANQADWLQRHPEYFKQRYANTKRWLQEHPDYLAQYRRGHPERVAEDNQQRRRRRQNAAERGAQPLADIQDSILPQASIREEVTSYSATQPGADIQDSILPQVILAAEFAADYVMRRYTRLDRPDELPGVLSAAVGTPSPCGAPSSPTTSRGGES